VPLISVDLGPLAASLAASMPKRGDRQVILRQLGAVAMAMWKSLARNELRTSSRDYVAGLTYDQRRNGVTISLTGTVPNMIENGWKGGDMRQWLLSGPNAKQGAKGPYNTVPFRHGTPRTGGRNVGEKMPSILHKVAKTLAGTRSRSWRSGGGRTVLYGERLRPGVRQMTKQVAQLLETKRRPWHATSIYMGMIREEKTFAKATQTTGYMTFRRISAVSRDPKHWFHPGIKARHFAKRVKAHVESQAAGLVQEAIGK
jgi:hypothetical protein